MSSASDSWPVVWGLDNVPCARLTARTRPYALPDTARGRPPVVSTRFFWTAWFVLAAVGVLQVLFL